MNRRDVLNLALSAGAAATLCSTVSIAASEPQPDPASEPNLNPNSESESESGVDPNLNSETGADPASKTNSASETGSALRVVDSNVSLFRWPFRRLPLDETAALVTKLGSLGISRVWAGSFDAILHRDLGAANQRLADECRKFPMLSPVGSLNPELPGWEEELRRCADKHRMAGIRLHPNYQGYALSDPRVGRLLELATAAGLFVQIAVSMEDSRTQHAQLAVPDVDPAPLLELLPRMAGVRVQLLNHRLRGLLLEQLAAIPGVFFDTARVDGTDGVPELVRAVPDGRVLLGSHAPFLIPEAALIRTHESGQLEIGELRGVLAGNAASFLNGFAG